MDRCNLKALDRTGIVTQLRGLHHALDRIAIEVERLDLRRRLELSVEVLPVREPRNHGALVGVPLQTNINIVRQNGL